jgi:plastocyanin
MLALVGVAALCCSATASLADTGSASPAQVVIKDFMFSPKSITVKAGSTVTWVNKDDEPHSVVSDTGQFRSGAVDTDESFAHKFDKPGTYHFSCSIHPRMVGTIVVE